MNITVVYAIPIFLYCGHQANAHTVDKFSRLPVCALCADQTGQMNNWAMPSNRLDHIAF